MESHLICEPQDNRHLIQVLHTIMNIPEEELFIPSQYINEMKMSVEERLESLCKNRKNRILPEASPFLATPDIMIFQNFLPGKWYNATITLQNKEQYSRCLRIYFEPSIHFRLSHPPKVIWTKVAPGMTYQLTVSFNGDEVKDYQHQITFITEAEQFTIPVFAFRPRHLIDFPDLITMSDVPVNMTSEKNIILSNLSSTPGAFNITANEPCSVCPSKATLAPNEKIFLKVMFKTSTVGTERSLLIVKFDDDIKLKVEVECNAVPSSIQLEKDCVRLEDTFIGLQRHNTVKLQYQGIGCGYFKWKMYETVHAEKVRKLRLTESFDQIRENETLKTVPLKRDRIIDDEGHATVYRRIFEDEVEEIERNEEFLFDSSNFSIIPLTGHIGPNGYLEFTIIFSPLRHEDYETLAYLEIAGSQERLPLRLKGKGLGPDFKINVAELHANNIFICSKHEYEIIIANVGHIPGSISFVSKESAFGSEIGCDPETLYISPGHFGAFVISFRPVEEGKFIEKITFVVNESRETIHFIMTGNVIAPLLSFNEDEVDFGEVAFGCTRYKELHLINTSPVPIQYYVEIMGDGHQFGVDYESFLDGDSSIPPYPKEFDFTPERGTVDAESTITGLLTLLPNLLGKRIREFIVHMWGTKNHCVSIYIKHNCQVADITCIPPKIDIKFCFINYQYDRKIVLKNNSDLEAYFLLIPPEQNENQTLIVEPTNSEKYIPPFGETEINLTIETTILGVQEAPLFFNIFGKGLQLLCYIICDGQGPAVCFLPTVLNFDEVTLLSIVTKEVEIINDTPIPADITFALPRRSSFMIEDRAKEIPPDSKVIFPVSVYLTDPGKHAQVLRADVVNGQSKTINLIAFGVGTCINCDPKLEPALDLGLLLTYRKVSFPVVLINEGSKWHQLWFSRSDDFKVAKESTNSSAGFSSYFKIHPYHFCLLSKQSSDVKITGSSKDSGFVSERFYCHAVIEKSQKKQIIFSFDITGKFIDPLVEINKSELKFKLDVTSDYVAASLRDSFKIRNQCGLELDIDLVLSPPFYMVVDDRAVGHLHYKLKNLSVRKVIVEFQPPSHLKRCITYHEKLLINYRDHPKVDSIPVIGIINYPTLSIVPSVVDFECVPLGSSTYRAVILRNISPLPVIYKWLWSDQLTERKYEPSTISSSPRVSNLQFHEDSNLVKEKIIDVANGNSSDETKKEESGTSKQENTTTENTDTNLASTTSAQESEFSEQDCLIEEKMRNMLDSITEELQEDEEQKFCQALPECQDENEFSKIFSIVPHEGCLEPGEYSVAYFQFRPQPNSEVNAVVFCHILGGENEPITLMGKSRKISHYLQDRVIDFGKIFFNEVSQVIATIINDGDGKFCFSTSDPPISNGWLTVNPKIGTVSYGDSLHLNLKCFPGTVGRFESSFDVEIDYLEPATITVWGFGTYPQLYIPLPRPEFRKYDPFITYAAVAELGSEIPACSCNDEYLPSFDRIILESDDWVIVQDAFPCMMEIELSIERVGAKYQLMRDPSLLDRLHSGERIWPIPNFVVAEYLYDLGTVQINTKMRYILSYLNYGPGKTSVKTATSGTFSRYGFETHFVKHVMELGTISELQIAFHPTVDKFPELNTLLTEYLFLDVKSGPRIPIQLKALVATPSIEISHNEIDFGSIRCGDCLRMTINLINNGFLPSNWQASIEDSLKSKSRLRPSFLLLTEEGLLEPGQKFYLRIYFEPQYDDFLTAELLITVDGNYRQYTVELKGFGMEPILEINQETNIFTPNIPYSVDNTQYVSIRNASKFPVEFYFPDFDEKILQEDALVRYYVLHNKATKVYFDYRPPGTDLPPMFEEFYNNLLQEMKSKSQTLEREEFNLNKDLNREETKTKFKNSSSISPKSISAKSVVDESAFEEKDVSITKYIAMKIKQESRIPRQTDSKFLIDGEEIYEDPPERKLLMVFHGAPLTGYMKAAHETGKALEMPVYSLDRLIIGCLLNSHMIEATEVTNIINSAFNDVAEDHELEMASEDDAYDFLWKKVLILLEGRKKKPKPKREQSGKKKKGSAKSSKSSKKSSKKSEKSSKKTSAKSSKKTSEKSSKKSKSTKGSKQSKKSKTSKSSLSGSNKSKKKKHKESDTLINIPQILIREILDESLKAFPGGVIIESLESQFLRKTSVAFNCILQISKNIKAVYFVVFLCTFDEYIELEDEKEQKHKEEILRIIGELMASMDDMNAEEFERIKNEYPEIYKGYIEERKQQVVLRQEMRRLRKIQCEMKKLQESEHSVKSGDKVETKTKKKSKESSKSSGGKKKKGKSQAEETAESKKSKTKSKKSSSKGSEKSKKGSSKKSKGSKKSSKNSKSKKSSKKSSRKSSKESKKRKLTKEQAGVKESLETFEHSLPEFLHTLEFWDKNNSTLTRLYSKPSKKSVNKKSKKSGKSSGKSGQTSTMSGMSLTIDPTTIGNETGRSSDIGIPCWLINRYLRSNFSEFVPLLMKQTTEVQIAHDKKVRMEHMETPLLQSVLQKPKTRTVKKSSVFVITDFIEKLDVLGELEVSETKHLGSKISVGTKKRVLSKNKSLFGDPDSATRKKETFTARALLQPGEMIKYKFDFYPTVCGEFKHSFEIGVVGWPTKFSITCNAISDIPRIDMDPYFFFDTVAESRNNKNRYQQCVFLEHSNTFDFGGILLPRANRSFETKTAFYLNNISYIPCDITYSIENDSPVFQIQPESEIIEPTNRKELVVVAAPLEEKIYDNTLVISIKNNPKVERIKLSCYGCEIAVDVNPKHIFFERVTLNTSLMKQITITNSTPITTTWYFVNCEEVLNYFKISAFNGTIVPFSLQTVNIEFTPKETEPHHAIFQVDVYDNWERLIYFTEIVVSSETSTLDFDYDEKIDFGVIKGGKTYKYPFKITNRGKYEVFCQFSDIIEENKEEQLKRKCFQINVFEGRLTPGEKFEAIITFTPSKAMALTKLPVFKCFLIDPFHKMLLKTFDIEISAGVFLSKFEICPSPEIYFGYQTVGTEKIHTFQILNKGKFDFDYIIKSQKELLEKPHKKGSKKGKKKGSSKSSKSKSKSSKGSKKSKDSNKSKSDKTKSKSSKSKSTKSSKKSKKSKSSKSSLAKKKKLKPTTLKFGIFSLTSSTGTVEPEDALTITIKSKPKEAKEYQESLTVFVSEPSSVDRKGKPLTIHVIACEPKVNFEDLANVFKEQYTVEKMDDFLLADKIDFHAFFVKNEKKLIFNKVCVNTTATTRLRIQNIGHVPAPVHARFANSTNIFTVIPHSLMIDPYQIAYIMIAYTPDSLDDHHANLVLSCTGVHTADKLSIDLIGDPCTPEIAIVKPVFDNMTHKTYDFEPTLVGSSSSTDLVLKNVGSIPCKIIVEVCYDDWDQFSLIPKDETIPYLNIWEYSEPMKHTNLVNMECGQEVAFTLTFEPTRTDTVQADVKIHIVNNPFETKTIHVFCDGYYMDVILEGLPSYRRSASVKSINTVPVLGYALNFGYVCLNTLDKKCFTIRNNSDTDTYKFEFPSYSEVIFTPAIGHLRPKAAKQILAAFLSKNPVDLNEINIMCTVYKIEYEEPQPGLLSWDDRQHLVVWCPEVVEAIKDYDVSTDSVTSNHTMDDKAISLKKIEENPEPLVTMVENSWQNIAIFLSIVADHAIYSCTVNNLSVPDTFLMNKQSIDFEVANPGKVTLKLSWSIMMHDLPKRINSSKSADDLTIIKLSPPPDLKHQPTALLGDENFLFDDSSVSKRPTSASTLFSSETLESDRSVDSWNEFHSLPFSIAPQKTSIAPNGKETFKLTFAPVDVFEYLVHLKAAIENKAPQIDHLEIEVKARSILPLYYLELEPNNYIAEKRRGKKLCQDLFDENTKVVEFESIGLGVISTRKFFLKNPTKEGYFFEWHRAQNSDPHLSCFHCHTPNGIVAKGKTVAMVFSFIPQDCGIFEEFFFLSIPLHQINVTFLMAGVAREPKVYFDQVHLDLPSTVIGTEIVETVMLKNEETETYSFKFGKLPMTASGLSIAPPQGFIKSEEAVPITILYHPKKRGEINCDLRCFVEKIKAPLELNITGRCKEIQIKISYTQLNGKELEIVPKRVNILKLGGMVPHQKYEISFKIANTGITDFNWYWSMNINNIAGFFDVTVDFTEGIVESNTTSRVKMTIEPLVKSKMKPNHIYLKIQNGPKYHIQLRGTAERPPFTFSFTEYNFGPRLVQKSATKYYKTSLKFSNLNSWPLTLETGKHENHISSDFKSAEIASQDQQEIPIYFHPLTIGKHHIELPFYIDGKRTHVVISGNGVPLKLAFVKHINKFVDLGSVLVGKTVTKTIHVLNESECPVDVVFNFWERLQPQAVKDTPLHTIEIPKEEPKKAKQPKDKAKKGKKGKKGSKGSKGKKTGKSSKSSKSTKSTKKQSKKSSAKKGDKHSKGTKKGSKGTKKGSKSTKKSSKGSKTNVKKAKKAQSDHVELETKIPKCGIDFMTITPQTVTRVLPQKVTEFTITFSPQERVEPFVEKIFYHVQDQIEAFCLVKGRSIAPEFSLDRTHLTFGNVVVNYERKMNVVLRNSGDIPLRFKWLLDNHEENFSIFPRKGYVLAGTNLIFDVFFKPKTVQCWVKSKLICFIESFNKRLELVVAGSCIHMPPPRSTIHFSCPVRESDTKTVKLSNPTSVDWEIVPKISEETQYFVTQDVVSVAERSEAVCKITYTPMDMHEHHAILSFPTPDGLIVSYALKGVTKPPLPVQKIRREVLCKVPHFIDFVVTNWLQIQQPFNVTTTINGHASSKHLFAVTGNELIDVPPNGSRVYKWGVTPINEGPLELKVTFTNKTTNEYMFYEVSLNVLPNKSLDSVEFSTCARIPQSKIIKLENPVNVSVTYHMTCPQNNLKFEKMVTLEPHSVYYLELTYAPLKGEQVTRLFEASCKEMGTFCYNIILTAHPPIPEPALNFKAFFGQRVAQKVNVVATSGCQFEFDDPTIFSLDKVLSEHSLSIKFEPNETGTLQSRLILKSNELGEFIYPLMGESCPPKPQGPFLLKHASPITINFKNPFSEDKAFYFHVEPSDFKINHQMETIAAKKILKITVNMTQKIKSTPNYPITGRLMIYSKHPDVFWIYYLKENVE